MRITKDQIAAWLDDLQDGTYLVSYQKLPDPEPEPSHATLTDDMRQLQIGTMPVGARVYYTMPWALAADEGGKLWLKDSYPAYPAAQGTAQLKVARYRDGYHVWPVKGEKYTPGKLFGPYVPVAKVEKGK